MRRALIAATALAALAVPPAGAGAPAPRTFLYIHDQSQRAILGYELVGGVPTGLIPGSPFYESGATGFSDGDCQTLAWSPQRQMLFTTTGSGVNAFTVAADGALAAVAGSPFGIEAKTHLGVTVMETETGTLVFTSNRTDSTVEGFLVQEDGTLADLPGSPYALVGEGPQGLTAVGTTLVVACYGDETIETFTADPVDGHLVPGKTNQLEVPGTYHAYAAPGGLARVYVPTYGEEQDSVHAFAVKRKGKLKRIKKPAVGAATDLGASLAMAPAGPCYAVGYGKTGGEDVQAFTVGKKGNLVPLGGAQSSGISSLRVAALSPDGLTLVLAATLDGACSTYGVDPVTGALTQGDALSLGAGREINGIAIVTR